MHPSLLFPQPLPGFPTSTGRVYFYHLRQLLLLKQYVLVLHFFPPLISHTFRFQPYYYMEVEKMSKNNPIEYTGKVLNQRNQLTGPDDEGKASYPVRPKNVPIKIQTVKSSISICMKSKIQWLPRRQLLFYICCYLPNVVLLVLLIWGRFIG